MAREGQNSLRKKRALYTMNSMIVQTFLLPAQILAMGSR
jgi:hypothetical protein